MVTWVRQHKRLLGYLILAALLIKLAAPAFSQALSIPQQDRNSRVLVICTATGLKYVDIHLDTKRPLSQHDRVEHNLNADHCLLCNLPDVYSLLNTGFVQNSFARIATPHVLTPADLTVPAQSFWPSAFARAPPQA